MILANPNMPFSTDVQLSIHTKPKFPARCIVCSGKEPDASVRVGDLMVGWLSFFTDIPEGWGQVSVPIHKRCRRPFRLRRWFTRIAYCILTGLILWTLGSQIEALFPHALQRWGLKIAVLVLLSPLFILESLFPPRFDITVSKNHITFEFADPRYAAAFARQNNSIIS